MQQHNPSTDVADIASDLALAREVTLMLIAQGVCVHAALANGRRPLLMIDRFPPGVQSALKRTSPNGRGITRVEAAEFHGCQLECMTDVPGGPVLQSNLQAVRNG